MHYYYVFCRFLFYLIFLFFSFRLLPSTCSGMCHICALHKYLTIWLGILYSILLAVVIVGHLIFDLFPFGLRNELHLIETDFKLKFLFFISFDIFLTFVSDSLFWLDNWRTQTKHYLWSV